MALVVENLPASAGDLIDTGSIPGLGRSPGGRHGNPLQYSLPEEPHGQRSLPGYSPQDHKESDMTEATSHSTAGARNSCKHFHMSLSLSRSYPICKIGLIVPAWTT